MADFNPSYISPRDDILDLLPDHLNKILDVGCSIGSLGEQIKKQMEVEVTGIEFDSQMGKVAKEKLDRVVIEDLENINFESYFLPGYFDCLIFADILEHLKNPWDLLKISSDFLNKDGIIIASIPNVRHFTTIMNLAIMGRWPYRERGIHDKTHLRFFTLKNIRDLFHRANLQITQIQRNYRIIEKPHSFNRLAKCFRFLPFKGLFTFQYLIVAKKK